MPNVTGLDAVESAVLLSHGMDPKNYGLKRHSPCAMMLLCYVTRDDIFIRPYSAELDDPNEVTGRPPDDWERQIILENGIDPDGYEVLYQDSTIIQLRSIENMDQIEIWKGDRKW